MILLLASSLALASQCPVEKARYVLRNSPEVSAEFRAVDSGADWPSDLALAVHGKSGGTTWWLPWEGGTDGLHHLGSTLDVGAQDWHPPSPDGGPRPNGDHQLLTTDASYTFIDHAPRKGDTAPAHILVPDAGPKDPAFPTTQFFDFAGCSAADS